jgi:broad specificity phosphatase PhoE
MSEALPIIYLARHGETAWSLSGQHTGITDLPLTERGERNARKLGARLKGLKFAQVFTSPLQRAARTCELAGFDAVAEIDRDLLEWNYGGYEGRRTGEILAERPDWQEHFRTTPFERNLPVPCGPCGVSAGRHFWVRCSQQRTGCSPYVL